MDMNFVYGQNPIENAWNQKYSELSDKLSSLEREHSEEMQKRNLDLATALQDKKEVERCFKEVTESMSSAVEKSRDDASIMENRIKEASVCQERLKLEHEKKVRQFEVEINKLNI